MSELWFINKCVKSKKFILFVMKQSVIILIIVNVCTAGGPAFYPDANLSENINFL